MFGILGRRFCSMRRFFQFFQIASIVAPQVLCSSVSAQSVDESERLTSMIATGSLRGSTLLTSPALVDANHLTSMIATGSLPSSATQYSHAVPTIQYIQVKIGDTLFGIARRHSVSVGQIIAINKLTIHQRIKIGQILVLSPNDAERHIR